MMNAVRSILVVGHGHQALLAAFALKRQGVVEEVRLLRTPTATPQDIAGEATPPLLLHYLSGVLGVPGGDLHSIGQPVWSLGTKYLWGEKKSFFRSYDSIFGTRQAGLDVDPGHLAASEGLEGSTLATALMEAGKLFPKDGAHAAKPQENLTGLNFRPEALTALLVRACQASGVEMLGGEIAGIERGEAGITALRLHDGKRLGADLYLDLTGPAASLQEAGAECGGGDPEHGCTRAMTILRKRGSDPLRPFNTVTQLDHGYQWRVEHADAIGLGIAWNPLFSNEAQVRAALLGKTSNLLAGPVLSEWRPGRLAQPWSGNVIALGDASGFVEPLAVSAAGTLIRQLDWIRRLLAETEMGPETRKLYNRVTVRWWDELLDFTALHYRFSSSAGALWAAAKETKLGSHEELLDMYRSIGPSLQLANCLPFAPGIVGLDGWLAALLQLGVPGASREIREEDRAEWRRRVAANQHLARQAVTLEACLAAVRRTNATRVVPDTSY